ncbi:MAG TPA: hypothetical protein VFQ26_07545 [Nitrospiraceae bacterium]|nr:hypothetical protein [Nitrospiraceae bacterium]
MERRMGSREAIREGTLAEGESGHTIQPLPASKQFSTRSCALHRTARERLV